MIDYHIHTNISADCDISMKRMADAAHNKGLKEICFTEHIDLDFPCDLEFTVDFNRYRTSYNDVKDSYPDINIRKGIEAGLEPRTLNHFPSLLAEQNIDYVIGSIHVVFGYDPYYPDFWEKTTKQKTYDEYARLTIECINACDFYDVLGHLGYIAKFCPYEDKLFRYSDYTDAVDTILKGLIHKGKGLEVNTNGLLMTSSTMPEMPIIKRYYELGGEIITIGSDAHKESIVGYNVTETLQTLKEIGFKYICAFDARKPRFIPIP